jgi:hypothetical protein
VLDEFNCLPRDEDVTVSSPLSIPRACRRWPSVATATFLQSWKKTAFMAFRFSSMAAATRSGSRP